MNEKFTVRCRAIIVHEDKLLLVKHVHNTSYAALPGGHLEFGEGAKECLRREIVEELGVEPVLGRLLYVNTFTATIDGVKTQPIEFFFEVINGEDFLVIKHEDGRSHAHELAEVVWAGPDTELTILPTHIGAALREGTLLSDETRFIEK